MARRLSIVTGRITREFDPLSIRDPHMRIRPRAFVKGFELPKTSIETLG
jgi:hypothetical protein